MVARDSFRPDLVILIRMPKSPEQLLADARRGSPASFLRLFDEYHGPVYRFAWRLTRSAADAEDIVQECFLALLKPGCGFDPARSGIRAYLFGAVRNQCLKRLRLREDAAADPAGAFDGRTPESEALQGELAGAVAAAIAGLPETQREVLLLAHYEQLPLAEIAEITQVEVGAVKSRLQRARAALREKLAAWAPATVEAHHER
jgi:RNA polymerase sigma-70 factor (ECF subfamily)